MSFVFQLCMGATINCLTPFCSLTGTRPYFLVFTISLVLCVLVFQELTAPCCDQPRPSLLKDTAVRFQKKIV